MGLALVGDGQNFEKLGAALDKWRPLLAELVTLLLSLEKVALRCRDENLQEDIVSAMESISAKGVEIGRSAWEISLLADACAGIETAEAKRGAH